MRKGSPSPEGLPPFHRPLIMDELRLTPNFTVAELQRTNKPIENECPPSLAGNMLRLAETLEQVRALLGVPIRINSGYRCEALNRAVNGVHNSAHLFARAADFFPVGFDLDEAFDKIRESDLVWDQLIKEPSWIHLGLSANGIVPRMDVMTAHMGEKGMVYFHV